MSKNETLSDEDVIHAQEIKEKKLQIRTWVRAEPHLYKQFMKEEYRYLFNLNKMSKKKANVTTVIVIGVMGVLLYEVVPSIVGLNLPKISSFFGF